VSEGREESVLAAIGEAAGSALLDVHSDQWHNRSVFSLVGSPELVRADARALAHEAVRLLDIGRHEGVHPRLGVVDVVPFVPYSGVSMMDAIAERDAFAAWLADALEVPCFSYGPERSLPEVRRGAFADLRPDYGPPKPHPTAGACCVGARPVLVAYNLFIADELAVAKTVARAIRTPEVRSLGLEVGGVAQVSLNLVTPHRFGPQDAYDFVAERATVRRAELVGLLPEAVLARTAKRRWSELDLDEDRTIERRLATAG
jgi:glutamate formiminotransferase